MNDSFSNTAPRASRRGPRPTPGRVAAIAEAARAVFTRQGFRLSQVADIAREAGLAPGTLYLYAADKTALLDLALRAAARLPLPEQHAGPATARLDETLKEALGRRLSLPALRSVASGQPLDARSLPAILGELYDLLSRERRLLLLLDRLGGEVPEIAASYRRDLRAGALRDFTRAIERLAEAGVARRDLDPALAARAVLEMVAWMAMRRPQDSSPPPGTDSEARATTLLLAEAALAPRGGEATTITPGLRRGRRRSRRDASP